MRGTGSLQELLGRSVIARRKFGGKRKNVADEPTTSTTDKEPQAKISSIKKEAMETSPLKAGNVRCPVCKQQCSQNRGNDFINLHIGKRSQLSQTVSCHTVVLHATH
jgi:hypothetical protein